MKILLIVKTVGSKHDGQDFYRLFSCFQVRSKASFILIWNDNTLSKCCISTESSCKQSGPNTNLKFQRLNLSLIIESTCVCEADNLTMSHSQLLPFTRSFKGLVDFSNPREGPLELLRAPGLKLVSEGSIQTYLFDTRRALALLTISLL